MTSYLTKRLLLMAVTLSVICFTGYAMMRLAPGSPAKSNIFGADTSGMAMTEGRELVRNKDLENKLHLDKSIPAGFLAWIKNAVTGGGLGESAVVEPGRDVWEVLKPRLKVTLALNIPALILTWLAAVPLGMVMAAHEGSPGEEGGKLLLFLLYSLPGMWAALMLQAFFCDGGVWEIFPLRGLKAADTDNMNTFRAALEYIRAWFLPVIALSYTSIAVLSIYIKSGMAEIMRQDYIRTARAKGVSHNDIIWKHGFRNELIPMLTLASGMLPGLAAGSVMVEYVFGIPGMGSLALTALSSRDYPLQMGIFVLTGVLTLAGIMITDILYTWADPRISFDSKNH